MIDRKNRKPFYKALFYAIAGASLLINVWLIIVLVTANYENTALRDKLTMREAELSKKHADEVKKHAYLDHFMRDEEFRNRVARDRLNYVAPNEFIFRFEEENR